MRLEAAWLLFIMSAAAAPGLAAGDTAQGATGLDGLRELERTLVQTIEKCKPAFIFIEGGSAFLVSAEGHVLTNDHVVGGRKEMEVQLAGGRRMHADLLGRDPGGDLALLKLREPAGVAPLELGDSDSLKVGQPVLALGDPFLIASANLFLRNVPPDYEPSVSFGSISALHRFSDTYFDAIQVDVPVNRGNSGGPLLTLDGKVAGINGKIETRFDTGINTGVGYAIPSKQILRFLEPLKRAEGGTVNHGTIVGLEVDGRGGENAGLPILNVASGSLAAKLGFEKGDRILELAGYPVPTRSRFIGILGTYPAGDEVTVKLARGSRILELKAPLVEAGAPFLGVDTEAAAGAGRGTRVVRVHPGTPAHRGGLRVDDVILSFDGEKVESVPDLARLIQSRASGDLVRLTLEREGKSLELAVRLGGRVEPPR